MVDYPKVQMPRGDYWRRKAQKKLCDRNILVMFSTMQSYMTPQDFESRKLAFNRI